MMLQYPEVAGLDLDAHVPTPRGYRRFGDLVVGDQVCDRDGGRCRIQSIEDSLGKCAALELIFEDATSVIAGTLQLWHSFPEGMTTQQLESRIAVSDTLPKLPPGNSAIRAVRMVPSRILRSIHTDADDPWFLVGRGASATASIVSIERS